MVHGVDAVRGGIALDGVGGLIGYPLFEEVSILHAVGVSQAAPGYVALWVVCLSGNTGCGLADGSGNDFDFAVGINLVEAGNKSIQVLLGHGGVKDKCVADVLCKCGCAKGAQEAKGQHKGKNSLHGLYSPFL